MTTGKMIEEYNESHENSMMTLVSGSNPPSVLRQIDNATSKKWGEDYGHSSKRIKGYGSVDLWIIFKS